MNSNVGMVVITGGSLGLGYETALAIACQCKTWHIVIAARTQAALEAAAERIKQESDNPNIHALPLDLASLESVRAFAMQVEELVERKNAPLRVLICNAGLQIVSGTYSSKDGYEMTFAINHLGHYLLARLLLGSISADGRIVFLGSSTHDPARKTGLGNVVYTSARALSEPITPREHPRIVGRLRYATSKLLNILTAYEMARRIKADGSTVTVNAFDPGLMPGSGLARDYAPIIRWIWTNVMAAMIPLRATWSSPRISGEALATFVLDPQYAQVNGGYYGMERKRLAKLESSVDSHNLAYARDLWETSAAMVGLDETLDTSSKEVSLARA
jgi:NAD(P)-dependent dehydrogenase (short-subunit alcohol dehydrogenase family)